MVVAVPPPGAPRSREPAPGRRPAAPDVELPRARVVSAAALPAPPSPRVHALAHVHSLRRRSCGPTGHRRRPVRALAPPSDGSMKSASSNTLEVKRRAIELGFDAVGIATLERNAHAAELDRWLAAGYAGGMAYLRRQAEQRKEPGRIMANATVAVVTLTSYFHGPADSPPPPDRAKVAQYAWSGDYHRILGARLARLADAIGRISPGAH